MSENRAGSTIRYDTIHFIVPVGEICLKLQVLHTFLCLSEEARQGYECNYKKEGKITGRQIKMVDLNV